MNHHESLLWIRINYPESSWIADEPPWIYGELPWILAEVVIVSGCYLLPPKRLVTFHACSSPKRLQWVSVNRFGRYSTVIVDSGTFGLMIGSPGQACHHFTRINLGVSDIDFSRGGFGVWFIYAGPNLKPHKNQSHLWDGRAWWPEATQCAWQKALPKRVKRKTFSGAKTWCKTIRVQVNGGRNGSLTMLVYQRKHQSEACLLWHFCDFPGDLPIGLHNTCRPSTRAQQIPMNDLPGMLWRPCSGFGCHE